MLIDVRRFFSFRFSHHIHLANITVLLFWILIIALNEANFRRSLHLFYPFLYRIYVCQYYNLIFSIFHRTILNNFCKASFPFFPVFSFFFFFIVFIFPLLHELKKYERVLTNPKGAVNRGKSNFHARNLDKNPRDTDGALYEEFPFNLYLNRLLSRLLFILVSLIEQLEYTRLLS